MPNKIETQLLQELDAYCKEIDPVYSETVKEFVIKNGFINMLNELRQQGTLNLNIQ